MRVLALAISALFVAAPALADEAVVVPDDNGRTVIREHGLFHDKTTIIDHSKPDTVVVPENRDEVIVTPNDGPSTGEVGVDVETHERVSPRDDD
jgi:hypothetical protein